MNSLFYNSNMYQSQTTNNSYRGRTSHLPSSSPASQYQCQKIIQNTVRVQSSLYTMNLAGLSSYNSPSKFPQVVEQAGTSYIVPSHTYWNQMSDRASPSVQHVKTVSGSAYRGSSTRNTIVRNRPGAMSPGGIGVDIKHNSYERRLNKLKGKAPLRRGVIPPNYGQPIPYNTAYPVKGGKTVKTGIINSCGCSNNNDELIVYKDESNSIQDKIWSVSYQFTVGDIVWAKKVDHSELFKAQIKSIHDNIYKIVFADDLSNEIETYKQSLIPYFDCNCADRQSFVEAILNFKDKSTYTTLDYIALNSELDCKILELLEADTVF